MRLVLYKSFVVVDILTDALTCLIGLFRDIRLAVDFQNSTNVLMLGIEGGGWCIKFDLKL